MNGEHFDNNGGIQIKRFSGFLLYPNGAMVEIRGGNRTNTPADPYEAAKLIDIYWQARLALAIEEFQNYHSAIVGRCHIALKQTFCPPPPDREEAVAKMKGLQEKCLKYNERAKQAAAEVEANKPQQMISREEANAASRQANEDLVHEFKQIQI